MWHLELFAQVVGDLLQEKERGVAVEVSLHLLRVLCSEEELGYQQLQVQQVRLEGIEVVQLHSQAAEMRLVLQTVDDAVLREGQHRGPAHLLQRLIAEKCVDRLVSSLDVLPVANDIEQCLCCFLIEECALGSRTISQSRVPDRFADRDARVPGDLWALVPEAGHQSPLDG